MTVQHREVIQNPSAPFLGLGFPTGVLNCTPAAREGSPDDLTLLRFPVECGPESSSLVVALHWLGISSGWAIGAR